ncbi:MAG: hypothetical protein J6M94_02090, partial [Prevotella sp.]|nr:hypothetical protein [Prevotella sp.]
CTFAHDFVSFVVSQLQNYKILGERLMSGPLFLWILHYTEVLSDSNNLNPYVVHSNHAANIQQICGSAKEKGKKMVVFFCEDTLGTVLVRRSKKVSIKDF